MVHNIRSKAYAYLQHQLPAQCNFFLQRYEAGAYASFTTECLIRVANTARETNTLVLLPAVLFLLCTRPMDDLLKYSLPEVSNDITLLPSYFMAVLKGRPRISFFARKNIYSFAFFNKEGAGCRNIAHCRGLNSSWAETLEQTEGWTDPFERPFDAIQFLSLRFSRCPVCREKATEEMQKGRTNMPTIFDLPEWNEMARLSQTLDDL